MWTGEEPVGPHREWVQRQLDHLIPEPNNHRPTGEIEVGERKEFV